MKALKEKIRLEGSVIGTEIVKVDSFLNHQIDVEFLEEVGLEFSKRFAGLHIDRILTVEASGIAIACLAAPYFGYPPVVFAKKAAPSTMNAGFYEAEAKSFTKGTVSVLKLAKDYVKEGENVLILDDFLASGQASLALADIVEQAGNSERLDIFDLLGEEMHELQCLLQHVQGMFAQAALVRTMVLGASRSTIEIRLFQPVQ